MKNKIKKLVHLLDGFAEKTGDLISWVIIGMVFLTFIVVIFRYLFDMGWIWMQESITYLHGTLFTVAAGYTLLKNEHVRVDIIYRPASAQTKAIIDLFGVFFLLFPLSILIIYYAFPYVLTSWSILERSGETGGIPAVFLLKTLVLIFPVLIAVQGISQALRSLLVLLENGSRPELKKQ